MLSNEIPPKTAQQLSRWTALSAIALIAVTWRLWTPQTDFPQIPVHSGLCTAPAWLDWTGLIGTLVGLTIALLDVRPQSTRIGYAIVSGSLLILFCLDQHRFQPWAYELWLFSVVWLCCSDPARFRLLQWLLISVYFFSALGKLDFEFLHTVGQQMLSVVVGKTGFDIQQIPIGARLFLAAAFPLIELSVAIGLAFPSTRRLSACLAIAVHLGLVLILGPLGLNHRWGVLVWNVQVAVQAYLLFYSRPMVEKQPVEPKSAGLLWSQRFASTVVVVAIGLPCVERLGLWDHWPSWALYAPHSSRVYVEVATPELERLPVALQQLAKANLADSEEIAIWVALPIDRWSLQTLDTPIYPQARFQLGVAKSLAARLSQTDSIRVKVLGTASRFTGVRNTEVFEGARLAKAGQQFWVNHHPRDRINTP